MREVLWIVIGALTAYIAWQLWRAWSLRRAGAADGSPFRTAFDASALRQEIDALREELAQQRATLIALSQTHDALREQIESLGTTQGVSPEYNEALVCARRGLDAEAIAERCGISVAEAELVRSLAERQGKADDAR